MKKFFTSVFAALLMAAPVGNLSAQSVPMTKAEQDQFTKEVLPVVFEQIKEQAGIDILGWARPQITAEGITGFPVLETKALREAAAEVKTVTAKPDSIIINMAAISEQMASLGNLKVVFDGYDKKYLTIAKKKVELDLPSTINVVMPANGFSLAKITIDSKVESGKLMPFTMGIDISLMGDKPMGVLDFALTQNAKTKAIEGRVDLGSFIKEAFGVKGITSYLVRIDLGKMVVVPSLGVPVYLKGLMQDKEIPMGDAIVFVDLGGKSFPLKFINLTGYDKKEAKANKWTQLAFNMTKDEKDPRDLTLTVDKLKFDGEFKGEGEYQRSTVFTMSDNRALPSATKTAVQTVVNRVVNEMAKDGKASWYKMSIANGNKKAELTPVFDAEVTPYFSDDKKFAIADVKMNTYKNGKATPMLVRAKAEIGGKNLITIQYQIAGKDVVTGYFTSNAAESILSNESVAVSNVKVIPTANGVRILNAERANYRIYSISGALSANGTVSGDEMISTSNLAKGIYIIAVEANGVTQSIKFIR